MAIVAWWRDLLQDCALSCLRSDPGCKEVTLFSLPGRRELVPQQDGPFTQWSSHTLELSGPFFPSAWAQVPFGRECMLVCLQTRSSSIACSHWLCQEMLERSWQCCLGVYALREPQAAAAGHKATLKLWLLSSMNKYKKSGHPNLGKTQLGIIFYLP